MRPPLHLLAIAAFVAAPLAVRPTLAALPSFSLHPIPLDPAAGIAHTYDINDAGQIPVSVDNAAIYGSTALRLDPDGSVSPCGPAGTIAYRILPDGRCISQATRPNGRLLLTVGDGNGYTELGYPEGVSSNSLIYAGGGDQHGTIVGCIGTQLAAWTGTDLVPTLLGQIDGLPTYGLATSRSGAYIVGAAGTSDGNPADGGVTMPFVYSNGTFTSIEVPGTTYAAATGVNNDGTVIGYALDYTFNIRRGFTWRAGVLTWLAPYDQNIYSDPESINDNGLIVGTNGLLAQLWDQSGQSYYLGDLASLDIEQWNLAYAYAINDNDQVVGIGVTADYPSNFTSFLLSPIPDPTLPAIVLIPAACLRPRRR